MVVFEKSSEKAFVYVRIIVFFSSFLQESRKKSRFLHYLVEKCKRLCYNVSIKSVVRIREVFMENIVTKEAYEQGIKRVMITESEIKEAIAKASKQIEAYYDGRPLLLVSILKGAFVFLADLCRAINVPCEIGFMCAQSYYKGTVSTGIVKITMDIAQDISKYNVVIVEDIIDTGRTLKDVTAMLRERHPLSLHVVTLLDKPSRRIVDFQPDISLFTIPDHFVIGYGLDCGELYRNLPYIAEYNTDCLKD